MKTVKTIVLMLTLAASALAYTGADLKEAASRCNMANRAACCEEGAACCLKDDANCCGPKGHKSHKA